MSNVKVVKVENLKIGTNPKKTKKNQPRNIEYLQSIVRDTKKTPGLDLSNTDMITNLLNKKSKRNMEVKISKKTESKAKPEEPKVKAEAPKVKAEAPKVKAEAPKVKAEAPKVKTETPKVKAEAPKVKTETPKVKAESKVKFQEKKGKKRIKREKQVGKKVSKKSIISFFTKEDQKKIKQKTKRVKRLISSNLSAPIISKKTKKNFYKMGVKNILSKDTKSRNEINKMSRDELQKELIKNNIVDKDSNAPTKVLKDLYHLYLLIEANIQK